MKKEIRVICPSLSFNKNDEKKLEELESKFLAQGFKITCGKNVYNRNEFYECASIEERLEDLQEAFLDKNVYAIICGKGGFNVNQLLPYIDFEIIKNNPKIICGMSDITALLIAIYMKTGLSTYLTTNFINLKDEYTFNALFEILNSKERITVKEPGYVIENDQKTEIKFEPLQKGECKGLLIAGNLCTMNLLQGTDYIQKKEEIILFIEDDDNYKEGAFFREFDRNLESLLQSNLFEIKGILFGVFEKSTEMTKEKIISLIETKPMLKNIPIGMNINFGHTYPNLTLPIGANVEVRIDKEVSIIIKKD